MIDNLELRLSALIDTTNDSSWADVLDRRAALNPDRQWRRVLLVAACIALVLVSVASAVGLDRVVTLFAEGEPAPQRVVKSFSQWERGVPPTLGSGVEANRAIKVLEAPAGMRGTATLWVAPRRRGGFCTLLDVGDRGGGGECGAFERSALALTVSVHGASPTDPGTAVLDGVTGDDRADSVLIKFQDGSTARPQLVWVTSPVNAGFFVYAVPDDHLLDGHRPTSLSLYTGGDEIVTRPVHGIPPG